MLRKRLIPCLLLQNEGLVKTQKFSQPKYVGDPINAIRIFNEKEVDELVLLDIGASRSKSKPKFELIEQIAGECFMPLAYGGGVGSLEDAKTLFSLGVEKVCLQTAVLENPKLLRQISERFGRQSVVASVDVKKNWLGKKGLYSSAQGKIVSKYYLSHLQSLVDAGAGEIFLNSVDRDGMTVGLDEELIREVTQTVSVPVIASGGVGTLHDVVRGYKAGASAVAAGSFFVFHGEHRAVLITYPTPKEMDKVFGELQ